jgi:ABC-type polysaccharide/polyol phosphate export permease
LRSETGHLLPKSQPITPGLPRRWWSQRWLLASFVAREVRSRYIGSLGGLAWVLVHPLILLGIYALLFRSIFKVSFPELEQHPFVAFVAVALWPWLAFQEGVQRGSQAIRANASLVRKVAFSHELLVVASVSATFLVHSLGFALALLVLSAFGIGIAASGLPALVGLMLLLFCFAVATALLLAALQVFIPDVEQFLGPAFAMLFYATPILYPTSAVPEWLRQIMQFNPLLHFVEPARQALLFGTPTAPWASLAVWCAAPLLLLPALWFFRRLSPYFEDFL